MCPANDKCAWRNWENVHDRFVKRIRLHNHMHTDKTRLENNHIQKRFHTTIMMIV